MNLIEQLGGYRMAKEVMDSMPKDGRSYTITRDDTGISFNTSELHDALLEHRLHHNIFEFGDKVTVLSSDDKDVFEYKEYSKVLDLHFFESVNNYGHAKIENIRHCTGKEIAQGCRDD